MGERQVTVAAIVIAATVSLAGCSPAPTVSPTSTPLSAEELAFAEAEATYRAYIAALNSSRAGAESAPERFLSGSALEAELASQRQFAKLGIRLVGDLRVESIALQRIDEHSLGGVVCLDVSGTRVLDGREDDVTPADREDILGMRIRVSFAESSPLISDSQAEDGTCS